MGSVGSGGNSKSTVTLYGKEYELPEKLEYSKHKTRISKRLREFEDKRRNSKIEYANVIDENGLSISGDVRGGKGKVHVNTLDLTRGSEYSHIHPESEDGVLGGTFSVADIKSFSGYNNLKFIRAVAQEGTYTFSKDRLYNLRKRQLFTDYGNVIKESYNTASKVIDSLGLEYEVGNISYEKYIKGYRDAINTQLLTLHKWLLQNQKKYAYKYRLEEA